MNGDTGEAMSVKLVRYRAIENPHVGYLRCSNCKVDVPAWMSSGMSQLWPHFYCSDCSNVIHRPKDQKLIRNKTSRELLEAIANSLPNCNCGGVFAPGTNPKCPDCSQEFAHQDTALARLSDPNMIVINGAIKYGENGPEWKLEITDI